MSKTRSIFDVFLSHPHTEAASVEEIGMLIEDNHNLHVWLDKWLIVPGEHWQQAIAQGLNRAKCCAVFVGKDTPHGWFKEEIERALNIQSKNNKFRVIPVLLPGSIDINVDDFVQLRTWVDFRKGLHDAYALHSLICGIKGIPPGRGPDPSKFIDDKFSAVMEDLGKIRELRNKSLIEKEVAVEYQKKLLETIILIRG